MKKLASVLVASVLSASPLITNTITDKNMSASATTNVIIGDANGNGTVEIGDAICIYQFLSGRYGADDSRFTAMDYNCDGVVDKTDALEIQKMLLKLS